MTDLAPLLDVLDVDTMVQLRHASGRVLGRSFLVVAGTAIEDCAWQAPLSHPFHSITDDGMDPIQVERATGFHVSLTTPRKLAADWIEIERWYRGGQNGDEKMSDAIVGPLLKETDEDVILHVDGEPRLFWKERRTDGPGGRFTCRGWAVARRGSLSDAPEASAPSGDLRVARSISNDSTTAAVRPDGSPLKAVA